MTRSRERGVAAVVETSLVLPIILLVIVGTIDASRMVMSNMMLSYAVTAGARAATAGNSTQANVQTVVTGASPMLALTTSNIPTSNITTTPAGTTTASSTATAWSARTRGDTVTVTATYTFTPSNPLFTKIGSRTFTQTSAMTIP